MNPRLLLMSRSTPYKAVWLCVKGWIWQVQKTCMQTRPTTRDRRVKRSIVGVSTSFLNFYSFLPMNGNETTRSFGHSGWLYRTSSRWDWRLLSAALLKQVYSWHSWRAQIQREHIKKKCVITATPEEEVRGGVWSWICALALVQQHIHWAAPQQLQQLEGNCLAQGQTGCSSCGEADQSIFKFSQKVLKARPSFTRLPAPPESRCASKKDGVSIPTPVLWITRAPACFGSNPSRDFSPAPPICIPLSVTHEAAVPLKYLRCWCHKPGENVGQSSCWADHEAQWKSYHGLIKRC